MVQGGIVYRVGISKIVALKIGMEGSILVVAAMPGVDLAADYMGLLLLPIGILIFLAGILMRILILTIIQQLVIRLALILVFSKSIVYRQQSLGVIS
jgi:hypothetical protein